MYSFAGISTQSLDARFDDVFEECRDGIWATKAMYSHSEPRLAFKYRYMFEETELQTCGKVIQVFMLVLTPQSFCKKLRGSIAECAGVPQERLEMSDVADYGLVVPLGSSTVQADSADRTVNRDTVASCLQAFDGMIGFYLDKCLNMIGTTGWDIIREAKGQIKDAFKYSLRRSIRKMSAGGTK